MSWTSTRLPFAYSHTVRAITTVCADFSASQLANRDVFDVLSVQIEYLL